MSWEEVSSNATDIKKHKEKPFTGTYKGHRSITTKIGEQTIWEFTDEDGIPFGIYGFTNLNRAMESLETGTLVKITYRGTENVQTKFGMKDVHQVSVQVWTGEAKSDEPEPVPPPVGKKNDDTKLPF
jgi:hypothetical protein